ncbi:hypothetical protein LCGC14_1657510 [marine sediment metagenome]|uniref:Uncharacterized protein n=1 Tax=marine sediment metagenome TaxID=412755 RepID=A0A0F9IHG3_9ZZZZ
MEKKKLTWEELGPIYTKYPKGYPRNNVEGIVTKGAFGGSCGAMMLSFFGNSIASEERAKEMLLYYIVRGINGGERMITFSHNNNKVGAILFDAARKLAEEYDGITFLQSEWITNYNSGNQIAVGILTTTFGMVTRDCLGSLIDFRN